VSHASTCVLHLPLAHPNHISLRRIHKFTILPPFLPPSLPCIHALLGRLGLGQEVEAAHGGEAVGGGKGAGVEGATLLGGGRVDRPLLLKQEEGVAVVAGGRRGLAVGLDDLAGHGDGLVARHVHHDPVQPLPGALLGATQRLNVQDAGVRHDQGVHLGRNGGREERREGGRGRSV